MSLTTSQILDLPKTQKSEYLENETFSFSRAKKFIHYTLMANYVTKDFLAEVALNLNAISIRNQSQHWNFPHIKFNILGNCNYMKTHIPN